MHTHPSDRQNLTEQHPKEKSALLQVLKKELWPLFTERELITNNHAVFPIRKVEQAHEDFRRAEYIGKIVLTSKESLRA